MELSPYQQKVIEQVQKLLALSKSANEHEAALALAKAEALLEKYRLDMTQIEMLTGQKEEIIEDQDPLIDSNDITLWEAKLAHRIAWLYGCTTIRSGDIMKVIGRPSDIIFVRYLVSFITLELFRLSVDVLYKKRKDYKDSWFLGAVDVILKRLQQSKEETQQSFNNPHAVMTINNRYEEAMKKLNELYPVTFTGGIDKPRKFNSEAYTLGRIAGSKVQLSHKEKLQSSGNPTLR